VTNSSNNTFILFLALLASAGCGGPDGGSQGAVGTNNSAILDGGDLDTQDGDGDGVIEPGEEITFDATFSMKPSCTEDVSITYRACLMEKNELGEEFISENYNEVEMCAEFETQLLCIDNEFVQDDTWCVGGDYCVAPGSSSPVPQWCGWKILDLKARSEDGRILESYSQAFVDSLGFELLPMQEE